MDLTKNQQEKLQKVKTYLRNIGKIYFKNNKLTRARVGMSRGALRDVTVLLMKEGILVRYGTASNTFTYEVDFDLLNGVK